MVLILFYGVTLVDYIADTFNISDNDAYIYVVEGATYPSFCFIVHFFAKISSFSTLMMELVRKHTFLVGGSDTTSDNTYLRVSEILPRVLKMIFIPYIVMHCLVELDTLE